MGIDDDKLIVNKTAFDVSCGAGLLSLGLARIGFMVDAIDPTP